MAEILIQEIGILEIGQHSQNGRDGAGQPPFSHRPLLHAHDFHQKIGRHQRSQQEKYKYPACLIIEKQTESKQEERAAQFIAIDGGIYGKHQDEQKHKDETVEHQGSFRMIE